ncbi:MULTISPECIES: hypothetical protein [unclassified Neisseria]|uniref:hypothetical protein n=1 Tax=unclassified Neisseria TaxID=2623750 RepID=UPI0026657DAE|nr:MULTISPECIES: hypothetical protein [unclassified Neisseria]MDO1511014.1 hypothetical protein [Neisseria sp. MVDL19-042950]MDO1517273.1 hypothetical protein [Neisseria sp. MVDL18-041461]MDO1564640.1 hypothetical protein [Neisseria sp. MVDL20-010259]
MESIKRNSLLSPFAITGDELVAEAYTEIIYGNWGIAAKFEKYFPRGTYGKDLDLILFEFFVLGDTDWFTVPEKICLGRYSSKNKDLSVKIPVPKEVSLAVLNKDVQTVEDFLLNTFTTARNLICSRQSLKKLDFNFEKFKADYDLFLESLNKP